MTELTPLHLSERPIAPANIIQSETNLVGQAAPLRLATLASQNDLSQSKTPAIQNEFAKLSDTIQTAANHLSKLRTLPKYKYQNPVDIQTVLDGKGLYIRIDSSDATNQVAIPSNESGTNMTKKQSKALQIIQITASEGDNFVCIIPDPNNTTTDIKNIPVIIPRTVIYQACILGHQNEFLAAITDPTEKAVFQAYIDGLNNGTMSVKPDQLPKFTQIETAAQAGGLFTYSQIEQTITNRYPIATGTPEKPLTEEQKKQNEANQKTVDALRTKYKVNEAKTTEKTLVDAKTYGEFTVEFSDGKPETLNPFDSELQTANTELTKIQNRLVTGNLTQEDKITLETQRDALKAEVDALNPFITKLKETGAPNELQAAAQQFALAVENGEISTEDAKKINQAFVSGNNEALMQHYQKKLDDEEEALNGKYSEETAKRRQLMKVALRLGKSAGVVGILIGLMLSASMKNITPSQQ